MWGTRQPLVQSAWPGRPTRHRRGCLTFRKAAEQCTIRPDTIASPDTGHDLATAYRASWNRGVEES